MIELNKIYNMDCLVGMRDIPDKSIDMVLIDPPYLMNYKSNRRVKSKKFEHIINDKDSQEVIRESLFQINRVMKDNTSIFMFCSWHHIDFFKVEFEKYFKLKNIIVWEKNNHGTGDLKGAYAPKHEFVLFGGKGRNTNRRNRRADIVKYDKVSSKRLLHPTEKNLKMVSDFIEDYSNGNDIVLDCFMGSGTTAIACINTNRNYIGYELDETYFNIANQRIKNLEVNDGE